MTFLGADPHARAVTAGALPGHVNYLVGADRAKWHTNIPSYAGVSFHNVYPGVDLGWRGSRGQLEYALTVAPGAHIDAIALRFAGASGLHIDRHSGDLVLRARGGEVRQHAPQFYQQVAGAHRQVPGRFVLRGGGVVGFTVGRYDRALPLVIDPTLAYSTYLGGSTEQWPDGGTGIAVDARGSAYVTGTTASADFPTTAGAFQTSCPSAASAQGCRSVYVSKLNPAGTALVYSTYLGGSIGGWQELSGGIAVDASGDAWVAGGTRASDFPTTAGAFQTVCPTVNGRCVSAFVASLNPSGSGLRYSTYLGPGSSASGSGPTASGVALGPDGTVYVDGDIYTRTGAQSGYPTTPGAFQTTCPIDEFGQCQDGFLTKLNPSGHGSADLVYSTLFPADLNPLGYQDEFATSSSTIAVDGAGVAYLTGGAGALPTTPGAFQPTCVGASAAAGGCAFVAKLAPAGQGSGDLLYATYLGGSAPSGFTSNQENLGNAIALGPGGTVYVAGGTFNPDFPVTPGAFQTTFHCNSDFGCTSFFSKLQPAGHGAADLLYSTFLGPGEGDIVVGLAVDPAGRAFLSGMTFGGTFPTTANAPQSFCTSCFLQGPGETLPAAFVTEIDPSVHGDGSGFVGPSNRAVRFSTFLGGDFYSEAAAVAADGAGNVYVTGATADPCGPTCGTPVAIPFPTTPGAVEAQSPCGGGGTCASSYNYQSFVTKIAPLCGAPRSGNISGSITVMAGQAVCLQDAKVSGGVVVQPGGDLTIDHATISQGITSNGATSLTVCGSTVLGSVMVANSTGFVHVGDSLDAPCDPNQIKGSVALANNHQGAELGGDTIVGSVAFNGTTGVPYNYEDQVPEIEGNTIKGSLRCAGNNPAPINDGQPNTVSGSRAGQCAGLDVAASARTVSRAASRSAR